MTDNSFLSESWESHIVNVIDEHRQVAQFYKITPVVPRNDTDCEILALHAVSIKMQIDDDNDMLEPDEVYQVMKNNLIDLAKKGQYVEDYQYFNIYLN